MGARRGRGCRCGRPDRASGPPAHAHGPGPRARRPGNDAGAGIEDPSRSGCRRLRVPPLVADLLAVAVGAGCTPFLAVRATTGWVPTASARCLGDVLRACELGVGFDDALRRLGVSTPVLSGLADALATSERTGAPVGAALARVADEARASVRRTVEARARTVPVRLLFPLVFLVLPAFALLTVAPALLSAFART